MIRRLLIALFVGSGLVAAGGVAQAEPPPEPQPPTAGSPDVRGRRHPLRPLDFVYRDYDNERQNVGLHGRVNATRSEQYDSLDGWREPMSAWMR